MTASTYTSHVTPQTTPSRRDVHTRAVTANDLIRITPRGVRTAVLPHARGNITIDQVPDYALQWLHKHGAITRANKPGITWKHTPLMRNYLKRLMDRDR